MEPNSPGSLRSYHISISWPLFWLFCKPLHPQMCKSINVLVKIIFVNILPNSSFLRLMEWLCVFLICNLPHPLKRILPLPNWFSRVLWCRIIRQFGGVRGWNVLMLGWQRRHWAMEIAVDWAQGACERAGGRGRADVKKCINFVQLVFVTEMKVKTGCYFEINFWLLDCIRMTMSVLVFLISLKRLRRFMEK